MNGCAAGAALTNWQYLYHTNTCCFAPNPVAYMVSLRIRHPRSLVPNTALESSHLESSVPERIVIAWPP